MNKKILIFSIAFTFAVTTFQAQNVGINATGAPPNASAGLDIDFTNKGLLIPRVALTSATDVATIPSPVASLLVYNNGSGGLTPAGYYYWDGSKWVRLLVTGTPSDAWLTLGNAGTTPGTHFIGTTDNTSLVFRTNNTEQMRLHNTGQLSIGDNTPGGKLDVHQTSSNDVARFTTYGNVNSILLRRTQGSKTSPSSTSGANTVLGRFDAQGYDGSGFTTAARIEMATDATGGTSTDMPGRITFWTTPDNSGTPIERMRITNNGNVGIGTSSPNTSAILHVSSTNKGVMLPKVSLTGATDNITVPVSSPGDDGMFLYNTASAGTGTNAITPGYYYWQNSRWTKVQTSGYSGAVFGVLNPTTPNHLTTSPPSWQYTGSYIDLPPGKWVVFIYLLMSPNDAGVNQWPTGTTSAAIWSRNTLSNNNIAFSASPDIMGSPYASGSLVFPSNFGMVGGSIFVYNSSGSTKRYYLWGNINQYNTTASLFNFASIGWGENQFFAIPAE
jgi:hypothetical protein